MAREPNRPGELEREKAILEKRIARLLDAIADGKDPAVLVREIEKAEGRVREIQSELARLVAAPALGELDLERVEQDITDHVRRFRELISGNVPLARQALKKLLVDRLVFTLAEADNGRPIYAFRGERSYGAVIRELNISVKKPWRVC